MKMARSLAIGCFIAIACTLIVTETQALQEFVFDAKLELDRAQHNLVEGASPSLAAQALNAILSAVPQLLQPISSSSSSDDPLSYDIYMTEDDYDTNAAVNADLLFPDDDQMSFDQTLDIEDLGSDQQQPDLIIDLPYDIASGNAAAYNAAAGNDLLLLPPRMPVGMPFEMSVLQPVVSMADGIASKFWQTVVQEASLPAVASPPEEAADGIPDSDSSSTGGSSSDRWVNFEESVGEDEQQEVYDEPADMDITISIESTGTQLPWSRLFSKLVPGSSSSREETAAADAQQLIDIVQTSLKTFKNMISVADHKGQETPQSMIITMESTGPYLDATREEDFLATAAAVADAAVSAFSGDMDPKNEMTVDVQLTHTLERFAGSWPRLLLIGVCLVVLHVVVALLVVPHVLRHWCSSSDDDDDDAAECDSTSDKKDQQQQVVARKYRRHQQFIVHDGLREAGVYQNLLSEEENV